MRPVYHPCDGVARAAAEARRILYDNGLDPDAPYPCTVIAHPPLDDMPSHRMIQITVLVGGGR